MTLKTLCIMFLVLSVCPSIHSFAEKEPRCRCKLISTDMSKDVSGNTYQFQPEIKRLRCPEAIRFNTKTNTKICASPREAWVKKLMQQMTMVS